MRASLIFQTYFSISCFKISNFLIVIFFFIWMKKAFFGIINKKIEFSTNFYLSCYRLLFILFMTRTFAYNKYHLMIYSEIYIKKYSLPKKHFFPRYLLDNNSSYKFVFLFLQICFTEFFLNFMSPKCLNLIFSTKNTSAYIYI